MASGRKKSRFKSGFVSILGRPNAGKSTLLNALVGAKLAIVSSKPQTTRVPVQGVMQRDDAQVIFLDTPGIHEGSLLIHRKMMEGVRAALEERDLLLYVADASEPVGEQEEAAAKLVARAKAPVFLVLNKIDRMKDKPALLPLIEQFGKLAEFQETIPVSARTGEGISGLTAAIVKALPEGPRYFPPDHLTDQPERYLAAELIREQVLEQTRQEVPHAVAAVVEEWEDKGKLTRIAASVIVEREGQKRIVIGSGGAMLKRIGTQARKEMERIFGRRIFLELFVKARPGWRENPAFLDEIDWRYAARGES